MVDIEVAPNHRDPGPTRGRTGHRRTLTQRGSCGKDPGFRQREIPVGLLMGPTSISDVISFSGEEMHS